MEWFKKSNPWLFPTSESMGNKVEHPKGVVFDLKEGSVTIPYPKEALVGTDSAKSLEGIITEYDPNGKPLNTPGAKGDANKLRPWLVLGAFSSALEQVVEVGTLGAKKYTDNGWTEVPNGFNRYMDAFGRHLLKYGKGEMYDQDLGTKHIANMIWNLLAALEIEEKNEKSISEA